MTSQSSEFVARLSPEFENYLNPFEKWVYQIFLEWITLRKLSALDAQFLSLAEECRKVGCPRDSALSFWKKLFGDLHRNKAPKEEPFEPVPDSTAQYTLWIAATPSTTAEEAFAAGEPPRPKGG